ncbi:MAG: hypothetical protein ABSG25_06145 [Bryobacteraceae bacterium]
MNTKDLSKNQRKRERSIETWMLATMQGDAIERFDDLHIDEIDKEWGKNRSLWMQGTLEAHHLALQLRDKHQLPVTVAVAFSLNATTESIGVNFQTTDDLLKQINWMPPSLYLFRLGKEPWADKAGFQEIDIAGLGASEPGVRCLYFELKPEDSDEYRRDVFFAG